MSFIPSLAQADHSRHCTCDECYPDKARERQLLEETGGDGTTWGDVEHHEQELAKDTHRYPFIPNELPF